MEINALITNPPSDRSMRSFHYRSSDRTHYGWARAQAARIL
jgi:hypothetical protein